MRQATEAAEGSVFSACVGIGVLLLGTVITFAAAEAGGARPDLTGIVRDDNGKPLERASVFIYTAGPKQGAGMLCPSCYADCRKKATTDEQGRFKIESLDPTLLFRVLVVAAEHRPEFVNKVDPAAKPIEVILARTKGAISPDHQMKGRVVNPEGKPISGAVISIRGVSWGDTTRFGGNEELDQVAVTDDQGLFVINSEKKFDAVGVDIEARGYAKGVFQHLASGGEVHQFALTDGASVKGRLVKNGKPVVGVQVGICGADRSAELYVGDYSVGTDKEGRFLFVNLPPNRDYYIYGIMSSLGSKGSVPARRIRVNEDGSLLEAGDIAVGPGFWLAGQIRLSDGERVAPHTRVLAGREEAWDTSQIEADEQGRFSFEGVPPETIHLSAGIKGYRFSYHNRSLDPNSEFSLIGTVMADKTDLVLEFEPGENSRHQRGEYVDLRQEPLLGAEPIKPGTGDIHVTGRVIDAETGKAVESFTITQGRKQQFPESIQWIQTRKTEGSHGQLDMFLSKGRTPPAIMVEAEGYLPQAYGPIEAAETHITFALKKGADLRGVVLTPQGQPASGVTVYLTDVRNGVYVQDESMKVREGVYNATRSARTEDNGTFSFKRQLDDCAVVILADEGFAQVPVEQLSTNEEVRLQPWARVEGRLLIGSRPGTNEIVCLWPVQLPYEYYPRTFPPLQLYLQTTTDNAGQFAFERVPPINVQVYYMPKVKDKAFGINPMSQLTSFTLNPAEAKQVVLGGQGRPVIGRCVVKGYDGHIDWRAEVQSLELILPPIEALPNLPQLSQKLAGQVQAADSKPEKDRLLEEMHKKMNEAAERQQAFYATDQGREYFFKNKRYALNFAQDGSFRVEDVPGGKYRLSIELRESGADPMWFNAPVIASLNKEIEVPDSPGGRSDEAFDLGTIELQARTIPKVGKTAPDFAVKTVADQIVRLSDFAGKYVLLDFWATWCGPCVAETPYLKAAYDAFKDDPRFRMLGLSLDPDIKAPREYARKNNLGWTMCFLGDWSKTDLPAKYGVDGIPSVFLIGPDGKIVAKDLRGENIKSAVEKALGKMETAKVQ